MNEPGFGELPPNNRRERSTHLKPAVIQIAHENQGEITNVTSIDGKRRYLLGRMSARREQIQEIQERNQAKSLLFLEPTSGNGQEIGQLSREHLQFHLEPNQKGLGDTYFVIDSVPGKNSDVVIYYKGVKSNEDGTATPPQTPELAALRKRYDVTNLVVLLPASDREVVKIEFTGSGSGYEPGKGTSVNAEAKFSLSTAAHSLYERA